MSKPTKRIKSATTPPKPGASPTSANGNTRQGARVWLPLLLGSWRDWLRLRLAQRRARRAERRAKHRVPERHPDRIGVIAVFSFEAGPGATIRFRPRTGGAVTPNEFTDLPPLPEGAAKEEAA